MSRSIRSKRPLAAILLGVLALLSLAVFSSWSERNRSSSHGNRGYQAFPTSKPSASQIPDTNDPRQRLYQKAMSHVGWTSEFASHQFISYILARNPQKAVELMERAPEGNERDRFFLTLSKIWFQTDPFALSKWLSTRSLSLDESRSALNNLVVAVGSPSGATLDPIQYLQAFDEIQKRFDHRFLHYLNKKFDESLFSNFADSSNAAQIQAHLQNSGFEHKTDRALAARARVHPEEVVDNYQSRGVPVPDVVMSEIVSGTLDLAEDLNTALNDSLDYFVSHQWSEAALAQQTADGLMHAYLNENSLSASRQLAGAPPGSSRDSLILAMAKWLQKVGSHDQVEEWLPAISDPAVRQKAAEHSKPIAK